MSKKRPLTSQGASLLKQRGSPGNESANAVIHNPSLSNDIGPSLLMRRDYIVGFSPVGGGPDPDQNLYLNYGCGGELNYNGYCSPEVDRLIDRQSSEADPGKRKQLVWEIERKLAEDGARPIMFYDRRATCWQPRVKGLTIMVNSIANSARMEDI